MSSSLIGSNHVILNQLSMCRNKVESKITFMNTGKLPINKNNKIMTIELHYNSIAIILLPNITCE